MLCYINKEAIYCSTVLIFKNMLLSGLLNGCCTLLCTLLCLNNNQPGNSVTNNKMKNNRTWKWSSHSACHWEETVNPRWYLFHWAVLMFSQLSSLKGWAFPGSFEKLEHFVMHQWGVDNKQGWQTPPNLTPQWCEAQEAAKLEEQIKHMTRQLIHWEIRKSRLWQNRICRKVLAVSWLNTPNWSLVSIFKYTGDTKEW